MQRESLRDFQLRPRETFLYTYGGIDLWEWEFRLLDSEAGNDGDDHMRERNLRIGLLGRGQCPEDGNAARCADSGKDDGGMLSWHRVYLHRQNRGI